MTFQPSVFVHQHPIPPQDSLLPGGDALVDRECLAGLLAEWLPQETPARLAHRIVFEAIRYKPGVKLSVVVSILGETDSDDPAAGGNADSPRFVFQAYAAAAADTVWKKLQTKGISKTTGAFFDDLKVVGLRWPWDPQLPGLVPYLSAEEGPRRVRRLLPEYTDVANRLRTYSYRPHLLRYRPERHAVLRLDFKVRGKSGHKSRKNLIARVFSSGAAPSLWQAGLGSLVPKTVVEDSRAGVILEEFVAGTPLEDVLEQMSPGGGPGTASITAAGKTLATFHRRALEGWLARDGRDLVRLHQAETEERQAEDIVRLLASKDAELAELWRKRHHDLVRSLEKQRSSPPIVVHGDVHPGQFLCGQDGVRLIDLEKLHWGSAAMDLGSMLFFLRGGDGRSPVRLGVDAGFLEGYTQTAGEMPPMKEILTYEALTALKRMAAPLRNLHPEWREWTEHVFSGAKRSATW